jgi:O-antigen ligase
MLNKFSYERAARFLWALTLVTLPVTSFRYFPFMGAGTYVRPLSMYPLAALGILLVYGLWRKKITRPRPFPGVFVILIAFLLVALTTIMIGALYAPVEMRGQEYWARAIRALVTVIVGLAFFVVTVWMNQRDEAVRFSVRWLLIGLIVDLAWSGIQFAALEFGFKSTLSDIQRLFSMRGMVNSRRISGFAFEPSWLAGQLTTLYLPWLFAALLTRDRISRWKWLEPALFVAALGALVMTYSRSGIVFAILAMGAVFLLTGREFFAGIWRWFRSGLDQARGLALRIGVVLIVAAGLIGSGAALASREYFSQLWNFQQDNIVDYIVDISAGARLAYTAGAMHEFNAHPWTGIGLGASGLYIYDNLPDWALTYVPEISEQLSPESNLYPNPKNLFARLLAETGLIGFVLFMLFYLAMLSDALTALKHWRYVGLAALLTWIGILFYGVIQDSFTSPENWINFGMIAGIAGQWMVESGEKSAERGSV